MRNRTPRLLTALLAFGLLTAALWLILAERDLERQLAQQRTLANQHLAQQEAILRRALHGLDALEALLASQPRPQPAHFQQLKRALQATAGVQDLFVAEPVSAAGRDAFEQRWRELYPNYSLLFRSPSSQRLRLRSTEWLDFLPVVYGDPSASARFGLGLDLSAEFDLIPDTLAGQPGQRALSRPFRLESGEMAVLALSWQRTQGQGRLLGSVLVPAQLLRHMSETHGWLDVAEDVSQAGEVLGLQLSMLRPSGPLLAERRIELAGRQWRLASYQNAVPGLIAPEVGWMIGLAGLVLWLHLAMVWWGQRRAKAELLRLVEPPSPQPSPDTLRNQQRLQALLETSREAILLVDDLGRVQQANPAAAQLFGYPPEQLAGMSLPLLLPELNLTAEPPEEAQLARRSGGSMFPVLLRSSAAQDDGVRILILCDNSERRHAERLLFESEQKYRAILDTAQVGIYLLQDGKLQYVNAAFAACFGRMPAEMMLRSSLEELVTPGWQAALAQVLDPVESGGRPSELLMQRPDGSSFYALLSARPTVLNRQPALAGSLLDISERKRAEEARLRAEIRNVAILEAIPDLMLQLDAEGKVMDCRAQAGGGEFGLTPECVGQHYRLGLPQSLVLPLQEALAQPKGVRLHSFEYSLGLPSGLRQFEARLTPASEGEWLLMVRDITTRKAIEAELIRHRDHLAELVRERTAELDTLFAASPLPTLFLARRHILAVNQAFVTLFGYPADKLIGASMRKLHDDDAEFERIGKIAYPPLREGGVVRVEVRYRAADGWLVLCEAFGKAIDPNDPQAGSIWVFQDIGERRAAEEALHRAKELAEAASHAKSEFLANMSHELRTPMHAVLSFAELGERRAESLADEKLGHYFSRIRSSGQRLLHILNDLLDLSKLEAGKMRYEMRMLDVQPLLREVAEEFAPLARPRGVEIVLAVDPDLPALRGDALRLGQVLRNLVGNALRYSPDGAQIILRAENAGKELQLMVEDAGVGIPPEELGLIFDKFVQSSKTNTGAGGTGLGLAICREIVAAHAGRIMAENRAEGGARFRVCLPWQA